MLQSCGQVNNYPRPALRFQRQLAAQGADPLAHTLDTESGNFVWADTDAVILHFEAQPRPLLKQGNGDFAGVGVFTDVIEQLLQQPIEGETHRFALRGGGKLVVKMAADTALGKGKLIEQMVQRLFKRQFVERRGTQLAQQLAGGVVNTPGELVNLAGGGLALRRIARPFYQLRLDLNGGDVLAYFVMQFARQAFAGVLFGVDQLFGQRPSRRQLRFQPLAVVVQVLRQMLLTADG